MAYTKYNLDGLSYVLFDGKHSYTDYGLVLTSYEVEPPKRKTSYFENMYTDGSVDLTESVVETPRYKNRKASLSFMILEEKSLWSKIYSDVVSALNGKYFFEIFISELGWGYSGRVQIDKFKTDLFKGIITMSVNASPCVVKILNETTARTYYSTFSDSTELAGHKYTTVDMSTVFKNVTLQGKSLYVNPNTYFYASSTVFSDTNPQFARSNFWTYVGTFASSSTPNVKLHVRTSAGSFGCMYRLCNREYK